MILKLFNRTIILGQLISSPIPLLIILDNYYFDIYLTAFISLIVSQNKTYASYEYKIHQDLLTLFLYCYIFYPVL
jgi:hypothetical protein